MNNHIEEKLKEFNNWYDDLDDGLYQADKSEIIDFIKQALQEQEERIKQEMKEKIEKGIGVLMYSSKVEEYEKDKMFDAGKECGLNFGISILKKLLKELEEL